VQQTSSDTRDEQVVADQELNSVIDLLVLVFEHLVELLSLNNRSGESIEDESGEDGKIRLDKRRIWNHMEPVTDPFEHSLLVSSWFLIIPTTISSLTRPPASMIFFASLPRSVPCPTSARSISPVARWHRQYFSLSLGAWVPLPEITETDTLVDSYR